MRMVTLVALASVPLSISATASAQGPSIHALETAASVAPDDGGAAIELANAYWRSGRPGDAYGVYRRALSLNNVMLETWQGDTIWSHDVARQALARQVSLSAR